MNLTPAMQQYYEIKNHYKEAIVFFRMWDFYEMFEQDAQIAHKILGITLTTRNKNAETPILLAGIPYHAKDKYLPKLVDAGYKVAIVEQSSSPVAKWIVEREVVRVVTPWTLSLEAEWYEHLSENHYLVSLTKNNDGYGMSVFHTLSNDWSCSEFSDFESCQVALYKHAWNEVILDRQLFQDQDIHDLLGKKFGLHIYSFPVPVKADTYLTDLFETRTLGSYGIENKSLAQNAAALLHAYLCEHQKKYIKHTKTLRYESYTSCMKLDPATIRSLDLVYNIHTQSKVQGTLFWVLNNTKTPMGKRFLHESILHPLQDKKEIEERQQFIQAWESEGELLDNVMVELANIGDLEALITRFHYGRVWPKDLIHIKRSLESVERIIGLVEDSGNNILIESLRSEIS